MDRRRILRVLLDGYVMTDLSNYGLTRAEKRALLSAGMDGQRGRVPSGWLVLLAAAVIYIILGR